MRITTAILAALFLGGCQFETGTSPALITAQKEEAVHFCAPDLVGTEKELSERIWGVEFSCPGDATIVIDADLPRSVPGRIYVGRYIAIAPRAWDLGVVDIVVAHEIGHWLGHGHPQPEGSCDDSGNVMCPNLKQMDYELVRAGTLVL